jgi:hypothetical protein
MLLGERGNRERDGYAFNPVLARAAALPALRYTSSSWYAVHLWTLLQL